MIDNPCVNHCTATTLGDDICKGCGRTFEEVVNWIHYTDEQKTEINKRLSDGNNLRRV